MKRSRKYRSDHGAALEGVEEAFRTGVRFGVFVKQERPDLGPDDIPSSMIRDAFIPYMDEEIK